MKASDKTVRSIGFTVLILFLFLFPVILPKPYYLHILIVTMIYIIVVASLRTVALSGQVSVAHAAFMGIGGYFSGVLSKELALSPWLTLPLGGVAAAAVAVLVGIPFTRVRAIYFSMVSLLGGIAIVNLIRVAQKWTGAAGLVGIPPLTPIRIPGLKTIIFIGDKVPFYYFAVLMTFICLFILYRIENCRVGMTWKAIAQSHMVASSVGVNEAAFRVLAFATGCFFAGIGGAMYAHYNLVLTPATFGFLPSIFLVMYMLVGGSQRFSGPVIGTAVLVMVPEVFRGLKVYAPLILGGIMVIVVYFMPRGISGVLDQVNLRIKNHDQRKEPEGAS